MQITLSIVYCTPSRIVAATVLILKSYFFYILRHLDWKQNTCGGCATTDSIMPQFHLLICILQQVCIAFAVVVVIF